MKFAIQCLALVSLVLPAAAQGGPTGVSVTVTPQNAAAGQVITVTLTNNSAQVINLPSSCVISSISTGNNCISSNVFTPICLTVITPIPPGQSASMQWPQLDNAGVPVGPNGYSVEVRYWDAGFTVLDGYCATFSIGAAFDDFCLGDGGDQMGCTNCPCGNNALNGLGGGCLNSWSSSARLEGSGSTSISLPANSNADLRFSLSGAPAGAFCILNSGDALAPDNMANPCFGLGSGVQAMAFDGLRCAITNTRRHGGRSADSNGEVGATNSPWGGEGNPQAGLAVAGGGFVAGQTRYFQVINRDDPLAVCMRGLNTSQAVEILFTP